MHPTMEDILARHKADSAAMLAAADTQLSAITSLASLSAAAAKSNFDDWAASSRALLDARDVRELVGLQGSLVTPALARIAGYWKSVYEIACEANAGVSKAAEQRLAAWNAELCLLLDALAKTAAGGPGKRR